MHRKVKSEADAFRKELLTNADAKMLLIATELLEQLHRVAESAA